jgi:hypothetical protein
MLGCWKFVQKWISLNNPKNGNQVLKIRIAIFQKKTAICKPLKRGDHKNLFLPPD